MSTSSTIRVRITVTVTARVRVRVRLAVFSIKDSMNTPVSKFKRPKDPNSRKSVKKSQAPAVLMCHTIMDAQLSTGTGQQ